MTPQIAVIGAGAFGTALANTFANSTKAKIVLLGRDPDTCGQIHKTRKNQRYLPDITLLENLMVTSNPEMISAADIILLAVPAQTQRIVCTQLRSHFKPTAQLVICAKGLDRQTDDLLSKTVASATANHPLAVLSGPGFAIDLASGLPTAMTIAAGTLPIAEQVAMTLSGPALRLYASSDIVGVQLGGALKNVMAIAAGMVNGAGLGQSAAAALIARGLAELTRLAVAMGARADTLAGLSGLGDLVLTATSDQSRNFRFGQSLGNGVSARDLISNTGYLVEGAFTAEVAARIARSKNVEMPITQEVAAIVDGSSSVMDALNSLMTRPLKSEI